MVLRRVLLILAIGFTLGSALMVAPALAHHSTAMYNMAAPVTVTGTVKRFEWTNPHAFVFLEVKDEKGNLVEWEVEMMSLNHLRSYGWTRNTLKAGDVISCTGGAAKSGAPSMISSYMKLGDGRMMKS
jgi:DNA/RNA endonuclease YhcR with UshA esterase domain